MRLLVAAGTLALWAGLAWADGPEQHAIAAGKKADVHALDETLPRARLDEWLQKLAAPAPVQWDSNDCGDTSGDFPICALATVKFPSGGQLTIQLAVGNLRQGVRGQPKLSFIRLTDKDGKTTEVEKLSEVPEKVKQ